MPTGALPKGVGSGASRGRAVGEEQCRTATPEGNLPEVFKASQDRIAASEVSAFDQAVRCKLDSETTS